LEIDSTSGVLPLDKPEGLTSHDVVDQVRNKLGLRRVGHTGTLDPFATGVLVVCLGPATRLAQMVADSDKEYTAKVALGVETDTFDPTGEIVRREDCSHLTEAAVEEAAGRFVGEFDQIPPRFSAVKLRGERAYEKARRGEDFEPREREVRASSIRVRSFQPGPVCALELKIECSKGFYVRALARDLGRELSCPAMLVGLRRTRVGRFGIDRCLGLADLRAGEEGLRQVLPPESAVEGFRRIDLSESEAERICLGQRIARKGAAAERVALMASGRLVAIAAVDTEWIRPKVVLRTRCPT
jgi:tRNA pseudouridine55 synthase